MVFKSSMQYMQMRKGKKDIGIFEKMEVNIGAQENWDLHLIMQNGIIFRR